jgi:hypothetical protein
VPADVPAPSERAEPPCPPPERVELAPDPATPVEDDGPPARTLGEAFLAAMERVHGTRDDAAGQ